ncbi:30S ribosomal protein S11 [Patescibacteria group bacterium]
MTEEKTKDVKEVKEVKETSSEAVEVKGAKEETPVTTAPKAKKSKKRQVQKGQAHIKCTYNNTIITLSDANGAVLGWSSAGFLGFKGAKKSTPYAATKVANDVSEKVQKYGLKELTVFIKGVGGGREASVRGLANAGFDLSAIKDITPIPHNGCRPKKPRRV